ncbi:MAG: VWA domain-containing protein [Gammaproteobacteria bacterium]|nr:VWA domain-containing protein [Gammaproteobacteria bacterium]
MISLAWPWLLVVLPLPWLARWLLPAGDDRGDAALRGPHLEACAQRPAAGRASNGRRWQLLLGLLAWLCLVAAAARPEWIGDPVQLPVSGRDLMLGVDLSGSMRETDFVLGRRQVDRLTATKAVAGDFIRRRVGDRIGLILFGRQAYLQAPLTFDRETVHTLLLESVIGLAGKETAIGDAIGLAVKRLRENPAEQRVFILLTDGANTAGVISPTQAAELAASAGLRIYTIGIGADEVIRRTLFGNQRVNPSADLDEETLRQVAQVTGGRYFRARDTAELEGIYALLDELEPVEKERRVFRPTRALFYWPLAAALALAGLLLVARSGRLRA